MNYVILTGLLPLLLMAERHQNADPSDYAYSKTTVYERRGLSLQGTTTTIDLPFYITMHSTLLKSIKISTDGVMYFQTFEIHVSSSGSNMMTDLVAYSTDSNFTLEYKANNTDNNMQTHFYITFFKDGYEKFLLQVPSNASDSNKFCEKGGCYQTITFPSTTLYSQCGNTKCFTYYQKCTNENDCRSGRPECYSDGADTCLDQVAVTISMSVIAIIFSSFSILVNIIRCFPLIASCISRCCESCSCRRCCCCCCQPPVPEPAVELAGVRPPDPMRVSVLQQGRELTDLHHPLSPGDLEKMECPICMSVGIDTMTVCQHHFHWKCLTDWIAVKAQCPYCRHHLPRVFYEACRGCQQFVMPVRDNLPSTSQLCSKCKQAKPDNSSFQMLNE